MDDQDTDTAPADPAFKTIRVSRETHARVVEARRRLLVRGANALPPALAARFTEASVSVTDRQKQIGLSVAIDLGMELLLELIAEK